jgi:hypothetical protein
MANCRSSTGFRRNLRYALFTTLTLLGSARAFYRMEAFRTSEPQLQKMYQELAEFEQTHVRLLQEKLAERRSADSSASR